MNIIWDSYCSFILYMYFLLINLIFIRGRKTFLSKYLNYKKRFTDIECRIQITAVHLSQRNSIRYFKYFLHDYFLRSLFHFASLTILSADNTIHALTLVNCRQNVVNCDQTKYTCSLRMNCQQTDVSCQETKCMCSPLVNVNCQQTKYCQQTSVNCEQISVNC